MAALSNPSSSTEIESEALKSELSITDISKLPESDKISPSSKDIAETEDANIKLSNINNMEYKILNFI